MWCVVYERHNWHVLHKTSRFQSKYWVLAYARFLAYSFHFGMTVLPVKVLCIYKSKNGLIAHKTMTCKYRNRDRMLALKRTEKKTRGVSQRAWPTRED